MTTAGLIVWHDHVSADAGRARDFYAAVLGWETKTWEYGDIAYDMVSVGGREHGGFVRREGAEAHWNPYVRVDDADEIVRQLEEARGTVHRPPAEIPGVGRFAVVADPAGAVFSLIQDEDGPAPSQDAFAWDELYTPDVDAAMDFYGRLFGWTTAPLNEGYTIMRRGEETVGGIMVTAEAFPRPAWLAYLATSDVAGAVGRATEHGAETIFGPIDVPTGVSVAVLTDPLGAPFGLYG